MKLLSIAFLCFQLCLTEEVPDLTAIYHVGRHRNVDYVDLHLRTNALGLPVRFGNELLDMEEYEFRLDLNSMQQWEHKNWIIFPSPSAFLKTGETVTDYGYTHDFPGGIHISVNLQRCSDKYELLLIQSVEALRYQSVFYYINLHFTSCGELAVHRCSGLSGIGTYMNVGGEHVYCQKLKMLYIGHELQVTPVRYGFDSYSRDRYISYSMYITKQGGLFQLWKNISDSQPVYTWNDESPVTMKYWRILSQHYNRHRQQMEIQSPYTSYRGEVTTFILLLRTSENDAQLASPSFIPKHKDMCMVTVFHTENSLEHPLCVYAVDDLSNKIQLGVVGNASKAGWQSERLITPWPDSLVSKKVRLHLEISNVNTNVTVERISSCNSEVWEDVIELKQAKYMNFSNFEMPVVIKQNNTFLQTEDYVSNEDSNKVLECQHNSVLIQNSCFCSPGFVGRHCEEGCGRNRFGKDCKGFCSSNSTECSGLLLCTMNAGCFCAPGYRGNTCEEVCENGTYGNNCTQICGHCEEGTCDIYTGKCSACLPGYQMPLCKEKYPYTHVAPIVSATTMFGQVTVKPELNNVTSNGKPSYYSIQYKKGSPFYQWTTHSTHPIPESRITQETIITGLEYGKHYKVRTVLIDADLNSYEGEDIPTTDFISYCIVPENPNYNVRINTSQSSFTASWDYIPENVYYCPVEKFEVFWLDRWKWRTEFLYFWETKFTVTNLLPAMSFKLKVRALTSNGFAPFSPVINLSTKTSGVSIPVRNLRVETADSRSVKVKWNPPLGLESAQLTYTVNYRCVKQAACQKDCADSSGKLYVIEPKVSLELLCPFSQYLISVSADDGPSSNLIFGTKIAEPVEAPEPSETPAVRTNTSLIVFWDQPDVCSGSLNNYVYQLYKANSSQVLKTGSTVNTNATFDNLHVSTDYRVLVFVNTSFGKINNNRYLEINVSTSATVPDKVQNLTVYKQGRHLLGLRWAQPFNTYGSIVSFTVKYGHAKDTNYKMEKIKPISCTAWPHLFCYTVTRLQADRLYKISVSARNSEVDADGDLAEVTGITKEKAPGPPENITLLNITSDSVSVQWSYPWLANGVVRSFLVSIEETEQFEEENCCQIYPLNEVTITDELEHYTTEVTGLHAASTYVVSISAKTVAFGPSQTITIHTRPPPLPILQLPNIVGNAFDTLDWEPIRQNFVNNSDIYKSLMKGSLVLIASDDIKVNSTGIKDEKLNEALKSLMPSKVYYLAAEYASSETEVHLGTGEDADGKWGEIHNPPLQANITYVLVVVQITEYCGVYNTDIALSAPFCAK